MSSGSDPSVTRPFAAGTTTATADLEVDFSYLYSISTPAPSGVHNMGTLYPYASVDTGPDPLQQQQEQRLPLPVDEMSALDWADDLVARFPGDGDPSSTFSGGLDEAFEWGPVDGPASVQGGGQAVLAGLGTGLYGGGPASVSSEVTSRGALCPSLFGSWTSSNVDSPPAASGWTDAPQLGYPTPTSSICPAQSPSNYSLFPPSPIRFEPPASFPATFPPVTPQSYANIFQPINFDPHSSSGPLNFVNSVQVDSRTSSTPFEALEKAQSQVGVEAPASLLPNLSTFPPLLPCQVAGTTSPPRDPGRVWWQGPINWTSDWTTAGLSSTSVTTTPPSAPDRASSEESTAANKQVRGVRMVALGPAWHSETDFFGPWNASRVELLDSEGNRVEFATSIVPPAGVRFDAATRTWITYRRNNLTLDVSIQLPNSAIAELYTTVSASPIERFEVEWTAATASKGVEIELLQFGKERRLSQAQRLQRQRLALGTADEQEGLDVGFDLEDPDAEASSDSLDRRYSTHFQRVRYGASTSNHPGHRRSPAGAFVMLVSLIAVHADGTEAHLGGWTSVPHAVRGSSPKTFGDVKQSGRIVTSEAASASPSGSVGRLCQVGGGEPKQPSRGRKKKAKKQACRRSPEYKSAAVIEDSDVELAGA